MEYNFNQIPIGLGLTYGTGQFGKDRFTNMTDDEKREYIERNRSYLSESELKEMTASLCEEDDDGPDLRDPLSMFHGPGIG